MTFMTNFKLPDISYGFDARILWWNWFTNFCNPSSPTSETKDYQREIFNCQNIIILCESILKLFKLFLSWFSIWHCKSSNILIFLKIKALKDYLYSFVDSFVLFPKRHQFKSESKIVKDIHSSMISFSIISLKKIYESLKQKRFFWNNWLIWTQKFSQKYFLIIKEN